ncbi:hypothetical protein U9M48_018063 [Paspalum notatum var. saurae]|uniref:Uncharacterized protein n=1 Tax=Paspalum notatum var. saurae TaxID=547442 RepID=A0AAQ3T9D2_PASNO
MLHLATGINYNNVLEQVAPRLDDMARDEMLLAQLTDVPRLPIYSSPSDLVKLSSIVPMWSANKNAFYLKFCRLLLTAKQGMQTYTSMLAATRDR